MSNPLEDKILVTVKVDKDMIMILKKFSVKLASIEKRLKKLENKKGE